MKLFYKKRLNGYFLFEIIFGITIASGLFLMIYRSYDSIIKNVDFLKNKNELISKKIVFSYNLRRDLAQLYFPFEIEKIYEIAQKAEKKNEKNIEIKDEKDFKKIFDSYVKYFPVLENKEEGIILKFFSTRSIFGNSNSRNLSEIEYKLILRNDFNKFEDGKKINIYSLRRSEKDYLKNSEIKDFELIEYIKDPKITFIYPKKKDEKEEKKEKDKEDKKNEEKKITLYEKWLNDKTFEVREKNDFSSKEFLKKSLVPSFLIFEGVILSENYRELPFKFLFSIPVGDYFFYKILNNEKEKKEDKKSNENFSEENLKDKEDKEVKSKEESAEQTNEKNDKDA